MSREVHKARLVSFLATIARPGQSASALDEGDGFVRSGLIDSLSVLEIVSYLEREYGLDFSSGGVNPADLSSMGRVLDLIERATA